MSVASATPFPVIDGQFVFIKTDQCMVCKKAPVKCTGVCIRLCPVDNPANGFMTLQVCRDNPECTLVAEFNQLRIYCEAGIPALPLEFTLIPTDKPLVVQRSAGQMDSSWFVPRHAHILQMKGAELGVWVEARDRQTCKLVTIRNLLSWNPWLIQHLRSIGGIELPWIDSDLWTRDRLSEFRCRVDENVADINAAFQLIF